MDFKFHAQANGAFLTYGPRDTSGNITVCNVLPATAVIDTSGHFAMCINSEYSASCAQHVDGGVLESPTGTLFPIAQGGYVSSMRRRHATFLWRPTSPHRPPQPRP
jgi:hypothetical protein